MGGAISAEHGIGRAKAALLSLDRGAGDLERLGRPFADVTPFEARDGDALQPQLAPVLRDQLGTIDLGRVLVAQGPVFRGAGLAGHE